MKPESQVNFRMPTELRDRLQECADGQNRTLTAEIVARLTASVATSHNEAVWKRCAHFLQVEELVAAFTRRIDEIQAQYGGTPRWDWPDSLVAELNNLLKARKTLWDARDVMRRDLLMSLASPFEPSEAT